MGDKPFPNIQAKSPLSQLHTIEISLVQLPKNLPQSLLSTQQSHDL